MDLGPEVITALTRWYPWEIQQLVSTYSNCNPVCTTQNAKCQDPAKFQFWGLGWGGVGSCSVPVKTESAKIWLNFNLEVGVGWGHVLYQSKLKVPRSAQFSIFGVGGGGGGLGGRGSVPNPRTGCSCQFEHKFCLATFWKPLHHR